MSSHCPPNNLTSKHVSQNCFASIIMTQYKAHTRSMASERKVNNRILSVSTIDHSGTDDATDCCSTEIPTELLCMTMMMMTMNRASEPMWYNDRSIIYTMYNIIDVCTLCDLYTVYIRSIRQHMSKDRCFLQGLIQPRANSHAHAKGGAERRKHATS